MTDNMAKRLWTCNGEGEMNNSAFNDLDDGGGWPSGDAIRISPYNNLTPDNQQYYVIPKDALLEGK